MAPSVEAIVQSLDLLSGADATNAACRQVYECMQSLRQRKINIEDDLTIQLIHFFTDNGRPRRVRRWIGLLLHEVLQTSLPNKLVFPPSEKAHLEALGHMVLAENEDLKLVAGMIIRTLVLAETPIECFCSADPFKTFPAHGSQVWMKEFQDFADQLHASGLMEENDTDILYAIDVTAEDDIHFDSEAGSILIMIQDNLTFIIPSSSLRLIQYIDVPLQFISDVQTRHSEIRVGAREPTNTNVQRPSVKVELVLQFNAPQWSYLLNAAERRTKEMVVLFRSESDANEAAAAITIRRRSSATLRVSSSQALDISKYDLHPAVAEENEDLRQQDHHLSATDRSLQPVSVNVHRPTYQQGSRQGHVHGILSEDERNRTFEIPDRSSPNPLMALGSNFQQSDNNDRGKDQRNTALGRLQQKRLKRKQYERYQATEKKQESRIEVRPVTPTAEAIRPSHTPAAEPETQRPKLKDLLCSSSTKKSEASKRGGRRQSASALKTLKKAKASSTQPSRKSNKKRKADEERESSENPSKKMKPSKQPTAAERASGRSASVRGDSTYHAGGKALVLLPSHRRITRSAAATMQRSSPPVLVEQGVGQKTEEPYEAFENVATLPESTRSDDNNERTISHTPKERPPEDIATPLINDVFARKATIISFGPQGPRNQGALPTNRSENTRQQDTMVEDEVTEILSEAHNSSQITINLNGSPMPKTRTPALHRLVQSLQGQSEDDGDDSSLKDADMALLVTPSDTMPRDIMSSNRKSIPASPTAESSAMLHIDERELEEVQRSAKQAGQGADPFTRNGRPRSETIFMEMLRKSTEAQTARAAGDSPARGLVETDSRAGAEDSAPSVSSAESAEVEEPDVTPGEMEWEMSLKPHQRNLADVLGRISRRLVRHLVDSESAVGDVVADYERDGLFVIEEMKNAHEQEHKTYQDGLNATRNNMRNDYGTMEKRLRRGVEQVRNASVLSDWKTSNAAAMSQIRRLEGVIGEMGV